MPERKKRASKRRTRTRHWEEIERLLHDRRPAGIPSPKEITHRLKSLVETFSPRFEGALPETPADLTAQIRGLKTQDRKVTIGPWLENRKNVQSA